MNFDHIFDELEIKTEPFAICELRGACNLSLGRDSSATLHCILSGEGEINLRSRAPLRVWRGSLVFIPAMQSHALHSFGVIGDPVPECKPAALNLGHLMTTSRCGEDGQLIALCAHVDVGLRGVADIIDLIREPLAENVLSTSRLRSAL